MRWGSVNWSYSIRFDAKIWASASPKFPILEHSTLLLASDLGGPLIVQGAARSSSGHQTCPDGRRLDFFRQTPNGIGRNGWIKIWTPLCPDKKKYTTNFLIWSLQGAKIRLDCGFGQKFSKKVDAGSLFRTSKGWKHKFSVQTHHSRFWQHLIWPHLLLSGVFLCKNRNSCKSQP